MTPKISQISFFTFALVVFFSTSFVQAQTDEDVPIAPPFPEEAAVLKEKGSSTAREIAKTDWLRIWIQAEELTRLAGRGAKGREVVEELLSHESPKVQLAAARALARTGETRRGAVVMLKMLSDSTEADVRLNVANVISLQPNLLNDRKTIETITQVLKKEADESVRLALAQGLLRGGNVADGEKELLALLLRSADEGIRDEAALVLGARGGISARLPNCKPYALTVRRRLFRLYDEPTERGMRAMAILQHVNELERLSERMNAEANREGGGAGEALFREVLGHVRAIYPDPKKVENEEKLYEDALSGMVAALDPFSQYMDRKETKSTEETLKQDYGGIGAYVGLREGLFVIESPIFGSPADKVGLEAMDVIVEVDGLQASKLLEEGGMNSVISKLKGPPDTSVKVKYMRRGFLRPVEVVITRARIRIDTVFADMLPGKLGYIRLSRFGERSTDELRQAKDRLLKDEGARGLVLDLRNNPGGLLKAAVEVSDLFLGSGKLIVYQEGRAGVVPRTDYHAQKGSVEKNEKFPLVILINGGSASASEIVSGALQDHKRAVLVGEKTFGKGSVQQLIPLQSTNRETQLRLTVAKYYLPSGRCIHDSGVKPDVECKPEDIDDWSIRKILDLRHKNVFEEYLFKHWEEGDEACKEKLRRLADDDEGRCALYPDFEEFFGSLNEPRLDRERIRIEIRRQIRRKVEGERKKEYIVDLESDHVLQRGVLELLRVANIEPQTVEKYRNYPEQFKPKPEDKSISALPTDGAKKLESEAKAETK